MFQAKGATPALAWINIARLDNEFAGLTECGIIQITRVRLIIRIIEARNRL